jgi:hypothetical protein
VYNIYDNYKASNTGLGIDCKNAGGLTKLVNNKVVFSAVVGRLTTKTKHTLFEVFFP